MSTETELNEFDKAYLYAPPEGLFTIPENIAVAFIDKVCKERKRSMEKKTESQFERMLSFLDEAWHYKEQIVPCLVGPVGIGKTAAVMQHAKNVKAKHVVTIIASQILPSEVSGLTMPDKDTKSMEIYDHYRLSSLEDGDILFFDELLEADQSVLSACLTLIESRQLMSGRKLPDIQIIAACNPTIQPSMLKENIRQRFMFLHVAWQWDSTTDYIEEQYGWRPPAKIEKLIRTTDDEYNILTPRSLTKLCGWLTNTPKEEREDVARLITIMWNYNLGEMLLDQLIRAESGALKREQERQVRQALRAVGCTHAELNFEEDSLEDIMNTLQADPYWNTMKLQLEQQQVVTE